MPKPVIGIKTSFAGGELAPALYSRVDLAKYSIGARKLRNFIVHRHGGISNRPGFKYIATSKYSGKAVRLIPFEFSTTQTYNLEFGNKYFRIFANGGQVVGADGWDDFIKTASHFDGSDGATAYTDPIAGAYTFVGTAELDTAQSKFGGASLHLDGDSDYVTLPDSNDWNFGAGDLTIDFWGRFNGLQDCRFIDQFEDATHGWDINYDNANHLLTFHSNNGGVSDVSFRCTWTPSVDTWYHIAIVRNGNIWYIFINGISQDLTLTDGSYSATLTDFTGTLYIGALGVPQDYVNGWIDEVRVSKGIARWTENFSPPTSAYATSLQPIEVATPYLEAELPNLNFTQSADVLYITHPDHAPMQLERLSATSWQIVAYDYQGGPFQLGNIDAADTIAASALTGSVTLTAASFLFDYSDSVGALYELRHFIEGQADSADITGTGAESAITCGGTWRLITHGTWTATIRIEKSIDGGSNWTMLREFSSADDFNVDTFGTEDMSNHAEPFQIRINCTVFGSGTCSVNLSSDPYTHIGIAKITAVAANGITATATVKRNLGSTDATADWAEGSWSPLRGWPSTVEFHPDDRLVFANTYTEPQTYWMTETGNYTSFLRSSPLVASDGISSPLPSRKVNGINGIVSFTEMIMLTLSNECSVRSISGAISPTTIQNRIHGWEGSYGTRPVIIGNRAIYVQSTGSIVRDLGFDLYSDSFIGDDLTPYSNHLFTNYKITEMDYQQNPDRILWAVRDDGKLLSMTYMKDQEVLAWTWHDTNDGDDLFESVSVIRGDNYDEVWVVVNRAGIRHIEIMQDRNASTDLEDQFFVDSGYTYDSIIATDTITGLEHLNGKTVAILADGVVQDRQVVANGQITLDAEAFVVQVGLPYNADFESLNVDMTTEEGTIQSRKSKISKVMLRVINSQGGNIGVSSSDLKSLNYAAISGYDLDSLYSGDIPATLGGGFSSNAKMFIRQSDPLPITITTLIPVVTVGGQSQKI